MRAALAKIGHGSATIQAFDEKAILLRFQAQDDEVRKAVLAVLTSDIGPYKVLRIDKIGPVVGGELRMQAVWSLSLALAAILIYMAYRLPLPLRRGRRRGADARRNNNARSVQPYRKGNFRNLHRGHPHHRGLLAERLDSRPRTASGKTGPTLARSELTNS